MDVFIHLYDWLVYVPMSVLYSTDFPLTRRFLGTKFI